MPGVYPWVYPPFEKFLADFCAFPLLKTLKIDFFTIKKADGQAFRNAEVQKSA